MFLVNFVSKYIIFFDGITEKKLKKISFKICDASICILNINLVCHACVRACSVASVMSDSL